LSYNSGHITFNPRYEIDRETTTQRHCAYSVFTFATDQRA